jgi:phosphotriesterase-related protein
MTVLGPVPVESLGIVLPHEHLLIRLPVFVDPENADPPELRRRRNERVTLKNLGWVRQYWTYNADNMRMTSEAVATAEVARFRTAGGSTVVDVTLPEIGRDPAALVRMSRASGVHIVMGGGAYVGSTHLDWVRRASVEELADAFVAEARDGVGKTGIRTGVIGEIGCSWPLQDGERRALRAAARAQRRTGLPISIHPGRNRAAPGPIVEILGEEGADLRRVAIGHLERTIQDVDGLCELGRLGPYLEFDCFGLETSFYPVPGIADIAMPSDAQRLDLVRGLIDAGFGSRILVSHDVCTKHRLARYGGHGYDHLVSNVMPWMRQRGFSDDEIATIFVRNPGEFLAIAAVADA